MSILQVISLGNDIVDWSDPDTIHLIRNKKFLRRVYSNEELDHCLQLPDDLQHRYLWKLWAAKEAAYKAVKRIWGDVIFAPKLFRYYDDPGRVEYNNTACAMKFQENERFVYASALLFGSKSETSANSEKNQTVSSYQIHGIFSDSGSETGLNIQHWISDFKDIQKLIQAKSISMINSYSRESTLCRTHAAFQIGQFLGGAPVRLEKNQDSRSGIPEIWINNKKTNHLVSTTHHGRFCAVMFYCF